MALYDELLQSIGNYSYVILSWFRWSPALRPVLSKGASEHRLYISHTAMVQVFIYLTISLQCSPASNQCPTSEPHHHPLTHLFCLFWFLMVLYLTFQIIHALIGYLHSLVYILEFHETPLRGHHQVIDLFEFWFTVFLSSSNISTTCSTPYIPRLLISFGSGPDIFFSCHICYLHTLISPVYKCSLGYCESSVCPPRIYCGFPLSLASSSLARSLPWHNLCILRPFATSFFDFYYLACNITLA